MNKIAFIPARGGSKRLPGKNLMKFSGKPLLFYSIMFAIKSGLFSHIIVSSDDDEILEYAESLGVTPLKRPQNIAGDFSPTISAAQHALASLKNEDASAFVTLQPTNPARNFKHLQQAFEIFYNSDELAVITVSEIGKKLGILNKGKWQPQFYKPGQRSQDIEKIYYENGNLYISSPELIRSGKIFDTNSETLVIGAMPFAIDIDTIEDMIAGESIFSAYKNQIDY
ncbi:acylneuraminate cytidylyltransferase family protein [Roseivirga echinicomitans]